ncbi:MAG TPA: hypothetical protein VFC63_01050 [Blastocatellia bacterium]|nr:hypothetical protein [Blastocatellia bacterium]
MGNLCKCSALPWHPDDYKLEHHPECRVMDEATTTINLRQFILSDGYKVINITEGTARRMMERGPGGRWEHIRGEVSDIYKVVWTPSNLEQDCVEIKAVLLKTVPSKYGSLFA